MIEETNLENSRLENFENWWFFWFENSDFLFEIFPSPQPSYSFPM